MEEPMANRNGKKVDIETHGYVDEKARAPLSERAQLA